MILHNFNLMVRKNVESDLEYKMTFYNMTLFRSITMLRGTHNIPWNILGYSPHYYECGRYPRIIHLILLIPHHIQCIQEYSCRYDLLLLHIAIKHGHCDTPYKVH